MKKLLIVLVSLGMLNTALAIEYSNPDAEVGSAIVTGAVVNSECDRYADLLATPTSTAVTPLALRDFVLENEKGIVKLVISQSDLLPENASASVVVDVRYQKVFNDVASWYQEQVTLEVNVNPATVKDVDYVVVEGAIAIEATVVSTSGISQFGNIQLVTESTGDVYEFLTASMVLSNLHYSAPSLRSDNSLADGNLYVAWDPSISTGSGNVTPEAYELEWTFLSDPEGDGVIYLRDYLFRNNSSRVLTTNTSFFIPLVYEQGIIAFRVRGVGKNIVNGVLTDVKTEWTTVENQTDLSGVDPAHIFNFQGLETNLNWQSQITYSEEGKHRAAVTYFDGSQKQRQAVTRINTDKRAIVGETMYDYQGRPVIATVPVPVSGQDEQNFSYRPGFNILDPMKGTLDKSEYTVGDVGSSCTPISPQFSDESGSAQYYSDKNGFGTNGNVDRDMINRDKLPKAKGFAYTETQFRNDNTGRVMAQSGVGEAHRLGTNHETKNMYGAPTQSEVTRLFGTQVGKAQHYKKNMVIDPNGQVSVSYLNPAGQTVATALAGDNSTNLLDIPGDNQRDISEEVLTSTNNFEDSDERGTTMIHKFPVTTATEYQFDYVLNPGKHAVSCTDLNNQTITLEMEGVFDLGVQLLDNCENLLFDEKLNGLVNFGPSVSPQPVTISKTVGAAQMQPGEYTLIKTLRLNETALQSYLTEYLTSDDYTCVLKEDHFINQAMQSLDYGGCGATCIECRDRVAQLIIDVQADAANQGGGIVLSAAEMAQLYERCDALCLDNITCQSALFGMLAHLSPDGQFGKVRKLPDGLSSMSDPINVDDPNQELNIDDHDFNVGLNDQGEPSGMDVQNDIVPEQFPLSIFNDNNRIVANWSIRSVSQDFEDATWRQPVQVTVPGFTGENHYNQVLFSEDLSGALYSTTNYLDELGNIIYAYLATDGTGYSPQVVAGAPVIVETLESGAQIAKVPLKYLADVKDFLPYWRSHFSHYLAPYHPEFGYLVECSERHDLNDYAEGFLDIKKASDDVNGEYVSLVAGSNPAEYVPDVIANDPIFSDVTIAQKYKNYLSSKVNQYRLKDGSTTDYYSMSETATVMAGCPNPASGCVTPECENGQFGEDDVNEWTIFASLYLTERDKVLREISSVKAVEGRYYNGCFANDSYMSSNERAFMLENSDEVPVVLFTPWQSAWNRICRWNWCQVNFPPVIQYVRTIDPNQTCADPRAADYKNISRAFFPKLPAVVQGENIGEVCYEVMLNPSGVPEYANSGCSGVLIEQGSAAENMSQIRDYESCGNCPKVSAVQGLLDQLITTQTLDGSAVEFNCPSSTPYFEVQTELSTAVSPQLGALLSWNGGYNATTKRLSGTISTSGSAQQLNVELDFSGTGVTEFSDVNKAAQIFDRIRLAGVSANDMQDGLLDLAMYVEFSQADPDLSVLTTAMASVTQTIDPPYVYQYRMTIPCLVEQVDGTGANPVDMIDCDFDPVCQTTDFPEKVLGLLNTLVIHIDAEENGQVVKTYDLNSTSSVALEQYGAYEMVARNLTGAAEVNPAGDFLLTDFNSYAAAWKMLSNVGGDLIGEVTFNDGANRKIEIAIMPVYGSLDASLGNPLQYDEVIKFKNVRPFDSQCSSGVCVSNKFYADAINRRDFQGDTGALVHHKVVIEIKSFTDGIQDATQPVQTSCEKIITQ